MTKILSIAIVFYLPVAMGSTSIPGWFARLVVDSIKETILFSFAHGGSRYCSVPRGGSRHLSPDAVTNVVHGYAHINDKKGVEEIVPVKSTKKEKSSDTKDDDWEDPFFHACIHNNDRDSHVVKNVVSKESDNRIDEEMFVKFSKKIFHYPRNVEQTEGDDQVKASYGIREFIQDSSLME
jgi:hypothetical protein